MKLRNKKTGEIKEFLMVKRIKNDDLWKDGEYSSLAEFKEKWEDYEEPKDNGYWYINDLGKVEFSCEELDMLDGTPNNILIRKIIGNYFSTTEEAKKAVEKLKAWKRLKDKGFSFERWLLGGEYGNTITFSNYIECDNETRADLHLLFGGEE